MGTEIERKFLLANETWRDQVRDSYRLTQGYICRGDQTATRIRITGGKAELNIKHAPDGGIQRLEFEYGIPVEDARQLLDEVALRPLIDKTRHLIDIGAHLWEIDEFHGENAGLIIAEIELNRVDDVFERPPWLGEEVSHDARYYNSNLSKLPFNRW